MNNLKVSTSQNVEITYKLASIGDRILATIIDTIVIIGYLIFLALIAAFIAKVAGDSIDQIPSSDALDFLGILVIFLIMIPVLFYNLLCEVFMNGQSFGKKAVKIKVVKVDRSEPSFGNYFARWILRMIDSFPYYGIGMCCIIFSKNSQRLGDMAAGTVVIKLNQEITTADTVFQEFKDDHEVKFENALRLTDRDVEVIKSIMKQANTNDDMELMDDLAVKIKEVLNVEETQLTSRQFLYQVLKDYNYLSVVNE